MLVTLAPARVAWSAQRCAPRADASTHDNSHPGPRILGGAAKLQFSLVGNDVGPLARVGSRDDGDNRIGGADVEDFVRNTGLDEDEVAGRVLDHLLQTVTVFVTDAALENVEHHLEADVNMGIGHAARWNGGDVHRERLRAYVRARQSFFVVNAVPVAAVYAGADHQDAVMSLNHTASRSSLHCPEFSHDHNQQNRADGRHHELTDEAG